MPLDSVVRNRIRPNGTGTAKTWGIIVLCVPNKSKWQTETDPPRNPSPRSLLFLRSDDGTAILHRLPKTPRLQIDSGEPTPCLTMLWMDKIHFAPPKKPWNPANTNEQCLSMVSKWCRISSIHGIQTTTVQNTSMW